MLRKLTEAYSFTLKVLFWDADNIQTEAIHIEQFRVVNEQFCFLSSTGKGVKWSNSVAHLQQKNKKG